MAYNTKELEALAAKFGAIPKEVPNKHDEIVPEYLTEEEFQELKNCPRTYSPKKQSYLSPIIGGRQVGGMSSTFNAEESASYNAYKGTGSSKRTVTMVKNTFDHELAKSILAKIADDSELTQQFIAATNFAYTKEELAMQQLLAAGVKLPEGFKFNF